VCVCVCVVWRVGLRCASAMSHVMEGLEFLAADETVKTMAIILSTMIVGTATFGYVACEKKPNPQDYRWLPDKRTHTHKRRWEIWSLYYGAFWMSVSEWGACGGVRRRVSDVGE
jgi:hypothetical protein